MRMMRMVGAAVLIFVAAACGGGFDAFTAAKADEGQVPAYETLKESGSSVELLAEGAKAPQARAAIADYVSEHSGDQYLQVQVVASRDASTVVCRGELVADEQTAEARTGGRVTSESWPVLAVECPS